MRSRCCLTLIDFTRNIQSKHSSTMVVISTNFFIGVFVVFYASVASAIPTPAGSSNITARAPAQHGCGAMQWRSRECAPERGPQQWDDVCENDHHDLRVPGIPCPPGTYCDNVLDVDPDNVLINSIQCLPGSKPGMTQPKKRRMDPQTGSSSKKQATTQLGPTQVYHQLVIADDMLASVSAFFLSESFLYINLFISC